MDNSVYVIGNATRDPELRYTTNGAAQTKMGIAVNRRWQNRTTQQWEEQVSFFNVVCWRELAENVADTVKKGNRVVVVGRLEQRSWETDSGDKRSVVEIIADDVAPSLRWAKAQILRTPKPGTTPTNGTNTTPNLSETVPIGKEEAKVAATLGAEPVDMDGESFWGDD